MRTRRVKVTIGQIARRIGSPAIIVVAAIKLLDIKPLVEKPIEFYSSDVIPLIFSYVHNRNTWPGNVMNKVQKGRNHDRKNNTARF